MLNDLKRRIVSGTYKPCITRNILKDPEAKLNEGISAITYIVPSTVFKLIIRF